MIKVQHLSVIAIRVSVAQEVLKQLKKKTGKKRKGKSLNPYKIVPAYVLLMPNISHSLMCMVLAIDYSNMEQSGTQKNLVFDEIDIETPVVSGKRIQNEK